MEKVPFHKQHRPHLIVWVFLVILAVVSGYVTFRPRPPETAPAQTRPPKTTPPSAEALPDIVEPARGDTKSGAKPVEPLPAATTTAKLPDQAAAEVRSATIEINGRALTAPIAANSTAYDLMADLRKLGQISFTERQFGGLGYFVESIEGLKNDNAGGRYWIYYINGAKATVGISQLQLKPGDRITWKYENED